ARELMTSSACRPVRHRPAVSVQLPMKVDLAPTLVAWISLRRSPLARRESGGRPGDVEADAMSLTAPGGFASILSSSVRTPMGKSGTGSAERSEAGGDGAVALFASIRAGSPVPERASGDCPSRLASATSDDARGCGIDDLADVSDCWIDTDA